MPACPLDPNSLHNDFIWELDTTSDSNFIYYGEAKVHSLTSEARWRIERISKGVNPRSRLANCGKFVSIWDNRLSLTYS